MKPAKNPRSGFSMADSLAALAVVTMASVAISQFIVNQRQAEARVAQRTQAVQLLNETAERMQSQAASLDQAKLSDPLAPDMASQLNIENATPVNKTTWTVQRPSDEGQLYTVSVNMTPIVNASLTGPGAKDQRMATLTVTWQSGNEPVQQLSQDVSLSADGLPVVTTLSAEPVTDRWRIIANTDLPISKVQAWVDGKPAGSFATVASGTSAGKQATFLIDAKANQRLEVAALTETGLQGVRKAITLGQGIAGTPDDREEIRAGEITAPRVTLTEERSASTVNLGGLATVWSPEVQVAWNDPGYDQTSGFRVERRVGSAGVAVTVCRNVRQPWCTDHSPPLNTTLSGTHVHSQTQYRVIVQRRGNDTAPGKNASTSPWSEIPKVTYESLCLPGTRCGNGSIAGATVRHGGAGQMIAWPEQSFDDGGHVRAVILYRKQGDETAPKRFMAIPQISSQRLSRGMWLDRRGTSTTQYWIALQLSSGIEGRFSNVTRGPAL